MEDAHITKPDFMPDISVFGVFDGHGGKEVAIFVEKHFLEELAKNKNFQEGKYDLALSETFLKMDELLMSPNGQSELNQIKGNEDDGIIHFKLF